MQDMLHGQMKARQLAGHCYAYMGQRRHAVTQLGVQPIMRQHLRDMRSRDVPQASDSGLLCGSARSCISGMILQPGAIGNSMV